jgi:MoaA/NifB/PqqE/SkfB family radical SAM enzyme
MLARKAPYDKLIREIYLAGARGPLRVALGEGSYLPYLQSGDVALVERGADRAPRPGEFIGVKNGDGDIRLVRFLGREGDRVRILTPVRSERLPAAEVVGRVSAIERQGKKIPVAAAASGARLRLEALRAAGRRLKRRLGLQAGLTAVYWSLVDSFESGVSETGDLLVTDRCTVGCRFCIYSCVAAGQEMDPALVGRAARAFRAAGLPRVRILGGEPFLNLPHLLACFRAIREVYPPEDIIILTSGYFGTRDEAVAARMDPLVALGLRRVHLSFDVFHLERYPVSCYERVLEYCREKDLDAALVVHYSAGLMPELETLLKLRARYPFEVRITMVSREGDARLLKESETSVVGFDEFRARLLATPGIELLSEDRSCFRWTVFPSGDVHFCCKQNEQNRVGNLARDSFPELRDRLRAVSARNRMNVLRFATCPTGEVSGNACLTCPLEAHAPAAPVAIPAIDRASARVL